MTKIIESLNIGSIGYNHKHQKDFFMDCPGGPGAFLFLLVKTPAIFELNHIHYEVAANSFVFINPRTPLLYKPAKNEYIDDWLYFDLADKDKNEFENLGIKFDTPYFIGKSEDVFQIIRFMTFEHFSADTNHQQIKNLYFNILIYKLSRLIKEKNNTNSNVIASKNEKLTYLRSVIFRNPNYFENIDSMAEYLNLSRSGFQHLYKRTFGVSVINDVIAGRIECAKNLLCSTSLTVAEIAAKCGYKTEYSFMRQFKEKTGLTPTEFRKGDNYTQNHYDK